MKIYVYAERGSTTPFQIRTMRVYSSIFELGKRILQEYLLKATPPTTIDKFVTYKWSRIKTYELETDNESSAKKISPSTLWKLMKSDEKLKPELTKTLLKEKH